MVSITPRPHFTPGKDPVSILQEAGWAPGPVWTGGESRPHRGSIPDRPTHSSIAIPTEVPGPLIYMKYVNVSEMETDWLIFIECVGRYVFHIDSLQTPRLHLQPPDNSHISLIVTDFITKRSTGFIK